MTASQKRTIEMIRNHFQHEIDDSVERGIYPQEFKQFTVTELKHSVYVLVELGGINDEGTRAMILCRERRHLAIGKRGGLRLLNAKHKTRSRGRFNALHARTE
jgi:hypothetical protein